MLFGSIDSFRSMSRMCHHAPAWAQALLNYEHHNPAHGVNQLHCVLQWYCSSSDSQRFQNNGSTPVVSVRNGKLTKNLDYAEIGLFFSKKKRWWKFCIALWRRRIVRRLETEKMFTHQWCNSWLAWNALKIFWFFAMMYPNASRVTTDIEWYCSVLCPCLARVFLLLLQGHRVFLKFCTFLLRRSPRFYCKFKFPLCFS